MAKAKRKKAKNNKKSKNAKKAKTTKKAAKKAAKKATQKASRGGKAAKKSKAKSGSIATVKKTITSLPKMSMSNSSGSVKIQMNNVTEVPDISIPSTGGQNVNLKALTGKKIVLYFYPKDMTPGCTIEGHEFTKLKEAFSSKNAVVYGVSRDTVEMHEKFKSKECYTIDLLSDVDEKLCNTFGVIKDKNMYGKIVRGIERSTFVIDENGTVIKEWRGVKAEGHAQEVLNFLTSQ